MSLRGGVLATGQVYHIFNRSVQKTPIFKGRSECNIFLESAKYYLYKDRPVRFSVYRYNKDKFNLNFDQRLVTVVNYCLMPNHFHFTIRQEEDGGLQKYMQKVTSSFSHYFGIKNNSKGHLFEGNFKAVRVEDNEQLIHLSRYIHLNPATSFLVEKPEDYPFSSYRSYLSKEKDELIDSSLVLSQFSSQEEYKKFVLDQIDYQRNLDRIKHLCLENIG